MPGIALEIRRKCKVCGKSSLLRHLTRNFAASVVVTYSVNANSTQRKEKKLCLVSSFKFQMPENTSRSVCNSVP